MKAAYYTLGCKVNQYDTQTMQALLEKEGYDTVDFDSIADVYIINTCTVTAVSDKKSRQMIARAHRHNPSAIVVVAGCYAQNDAETVLSLPGVRLALGNQNRDQLIPLLEKLRFDDSTPINAVEKIQNATRFEELPAHCEGKTRAHLKIQDGCNRFCSYCIIPYVRGKIRSRSLDNIQQEILNLTKQGFHEFVLTGIHLSSYGQDSTDKHTLIDVLEMMNELDDVKRIRLSSLEPLILTEDFVERCSKLPKLCHQFHVSLQSGSDTVLARMNRRYTSEQYARGIALLRQYMPSCAITTDLIAGFPGETEQEHSENKSFAERIGFARLHVFPYSIRPGTVAADMPNQVEKAKKNIRTNELIQIGNNTESDYIHSLLGSYDEILIEETDNGSSSGYTTRYVHAVVEQEYPAGTILPVRLCSYDGQALLCESVT